MQIFRLAVVISGLHLALSATTVLVMRHCSRSTSIQEVVPTPELTFRFDNNYSAQPWPEFGVPLETCMPRGADIVEGQGKWMREHGGLPYPIRVQVDEIERDVETALRFVKGLNIAVNKTSFVLDKTPFTTQQPPFATQQPSSAKCIQSFSKPPGLKASMEAALKSQMPDQLMIARLREILGDGVGGDWTEAPCKVKSSGLDAIPTGACSVAGSWTERLLMEWGGGMEVGWGRMKPEAELPALHHLHTSVFNAWCANDFQAARIGAMMARGVLADLNDGTDGTKIYVGHDTDIAALSTIFGISWDASPWAKKTTLPGSILRFDLNRADASVRSTYNYVASFRDTEGRMTTAPADFGLGSGNKASFGMVKQRVEKNTVPECAGLPSRDTDIPTGIVV